MNQLAPNYVIWGEDYTNSRVFHAEQFGPDDWRYTSNDITGLITANRNSLISALAHYVGAGKITKIMAPGGLYLYIDECRNTWFDGEYMNSCQWLRALVPVAAPGPAETPA